MLIIELTYKKSLDVVERYLESHNHFLKQYYDQGIFFASGPKQPRDGGIILALSSKEDINQLIKQDPFFKQDIANYKITEFNPTKSTQRFKQAIT